jgi:integrase
MALKIVWRKGVAHVHGTVVGRRIRKSLRTRDREIAEHLKSQAEARILKASIYGEEYEITFAEASVIYQESGGERRYLAPIIKAFGKERRISTIKPGHLRSLAKKLYPDASPATWNRQVITPTRAVINHAAENGLCPPLRVKRFSEPKPLKKAATRSWIESYCAAEPSAYLRAARRFMFQTGARISDTVAVLPRHLDLERNRIWLERTKNEDPGEFWITEELAREIATLQPKPMKDGTLRVFGYQTRFGMGKAMRLTCERAGIEYFSAHQAGRHSFATEMITRQRVDVVTTAKLGRWKSSRVLMDNYVHPDNLPGVVAEVFGRSLTNGNVKSLKVIDGKG